MGQATITLKVAEARTKDAGRGIVRIDPESMEVLNVASGDVVAIEGQRATVGKVLRGYPEDEGQHLIRMDGSSRRNTGVGIDDKVEVRRIEARPADKVSFAPTEEVRIVGGEEYLAQWLEGLPVAKGDRIELNIMGRRVGLVVTACSPHAEGVLIHRNTQVHLSDKPVKGIESQKRVSYEDIGGLQEEIRKVREMIELPLRHPELFDRLGIEAPKGILLHGPPGTGKTLLARAVANETNAHFIVLSGPEIMSKFYGESEANLRGIFQEAQENESPGEVERRVVAQLLALMDGLVSRGKVVVIGATNRPNSLDSALRRPGRFDREIEIGIPNREGRSQILQIHSQGMPVTEDVDLQRLTDMTHGYSGADLSSLTREAGIRALRRTLPELDIEADRIPVDVLNRMKVKMSDFLDAFADITPSTLREVIVENPPVAWTAIGGLAEVKRELQEAIEWPLKYPSVYERMGATEIRGILLYGPPGTGKTMLAKAVATETQANFISVKGPEFLSKWVGESEKAVRETFRKARQAAPCIVFIDEIDAIAPSRGFGGDSQVTERVISQILTEMDGLVRLRNVKVLAATNRPDLVDPAVLRPGRFDRHIYVPPPDLDTREAILKVQTAKRPIAPEVDLRDLAKRTDGYTGADLGAFVNEATMAAVREFLEKMGPKVDERAVANQRVRKEHFDLALKKVKPIATQEMKAYLDRVKRFARGVEAGPETA